jgi:hypothetical protein
MTQIADQKFTSHCTPYNDNYPNCERTLASIHIYSGTIHPSEVTKLLEITPTHSTEVGGRLKSERTGQTRVAKKNAWFLSSEGIIQSKDLRRHLDWILDQIYPKHVALRKLQDTEGVQMRISCTWWSAVGDGGPVLWPSQMAKMAELNLECSFEFADYSDD